MSFAQSGRASYRWLTITLLVAAGVYAWYANGQYGRLNDLNQRQLSNASAELKTALETAVETVIRFNTKLAQSEDDQKAKQSRAKTDAANELLLCAFDQNQPYLELPGCESGRPRLLKGKSWTWSSLTKVQTFTTPSLGIKVADAPGKVEFQFRFRTDQLLRELAFPDSFGLIFIATQDGEVLYQDAPTRRQWLRHLRWGEQTFRDGNADRPPALQIRNLQQVAGISPESWSQLRSVSSRTSVQLGGRAHQLYLQPLLLEHGERTALVIGGAVPTTTIVRDALALDTYLVGVLVFLLLLGILGFPFVKLAFLAPRERFRLWDINLLYMSTGALLVLMTCGSLALDGYVRWHAVADKGVKALAEDLERRFLLEVTSIRDQLAVYDATMSHMSVADCKQWEVHTAWFKNTRKFSERPAPMTIPDGTWLPWPNPKQNVHLRQVSWIGSDGWQLWKATADTIPGKSRVDTRVYFRAVQNESLFQTSVPGRAFFLGPDRSMADGKFYTYLSMKSNVAPTLCDSTNEEGRLVVTATAHLLSLDRQPLPAGYGFALVNREGRVLYHSDGRLSLRENLYEELSEGDRARAIVYAGGSGELKSRYRERPHMFYLHPVGLFRADDRNSQGKRNPAGFYLAVFRNTSVERTLVGHAFVAGLVGPMALVLGICMVGLWGLSRAGRHTDHGWSAWLWPHGGLNHVYKRQVASFVALLFASAVVYVMFRSLSAFLLTPILAIALGIGIHVHGSRTTTARRRLAVPGWQTSSLLLVLVCIVIIPSAVLFRLALSHEFAQLIVTERDWIAAQKADILRAGSVEALADDYSRPRITELRTTREGYFGCVPAPFDAAGPRAIEPEGPKPRDPEVVRTANAGVEPTLPVTASAEGDPVLVKCAPGSHGSIGPSNYSPGLDSIDMDTMAVNVLHSVDDVLPVDGEVLARQHFQQRDFAYSPEGTLLPPLRASGIAFLGFALMLGLLVWWIRWNTNRLFLADEETSASGASPSGTVEEMWSKRTPDEQMVLLQIARERIANPYQRPVITNLLGDGLLRMNPDLGPYSEQFGAFLRDKERELEAPLREWEEGVGGGHSWRYVRLILIASMSALGFFLIVTQPSLQSNLVGIASGITGALTAGLKLREALTSWFAARKSTA